MGQPQILATPDETFIQPNEVATATLELIAGTGLGVERPGGIFTKEDLINIKLYVKKGLGLPVNQAQVEQYIGYKSSGIVGLEPAEILDLFTQIQRHSLGWDAVQGQVIEQSIDLKSFSNSFVSAGGDLIDNIKEWPIYKTTLRSISGEKLEDVTFGREDQDVALSLGETLKLMEEDIELQRAKTAAVKNAVSDFRITLAGGTLTTGVEVPGLEPQVARKHKAMVDNKLNETIKADEDTLKDKEDRIEQLKKDYDKFVGLAFTGAAGGAIGLAITGGIFGSKAEAARKEKNRLIEDVRVLRDKVKGAKSLQKAIENLKDDFSDIGIRMLDAETALTHLDYMWTSILGSIKKSQEQWALIDDGMKLVTFMTVFKTVVKPWETVGDLSGKLMAVIDEALDEYKKRYGKV